MYEKLELTQDQIRDGMYSGDRSKDIEMVNAVLSGNVTVVDKPREEQPAEETPVNADENQSSEAKTEEPTIEQIHAEQEERYRQFQEEQRRDEEDRLRTEREQSLLELRKREEELHKEKEVREQLEKKLQELTALQSQQPSTSNGTTEVSDEEDEAYVSDYTKKTRAMVEELRAQVGSENPVVKQLAEKVDAFLSERETERLEMERKKQAELEEMSRRKVFNGIREFQRNFPELQTSKDIEEIEKEYHQFRKDMARATKVSSVYELEKVLSDYFAGGEHKRMAEQKGIRPPEDYQKYLTFVELKDLKNGVQYDPVTGKEIPILNDEGNQVKYRSMEEAYIVKNYKRELEEARKRSSKEIAKKLSEANSGAVQLPSDYVGPAVTGMTVDQERAILKMHPREYMNDPQKFELVKKFYNNLGLDVPQYRGRKN